MISFANCVTKPARPRKREKLFLFLLPSSISTRSSGWFKILESRDRGDGSKNENLKKGKNRSRSAYFPRVSLHFKILRFEIFPLSFFFRYIETTSGYCYHNVIPHGTSLSTSLDTIILFIVVYLSFSCMPHVRPALPTPPSLHHNDHTRGTTYTYLYVCVLLDLYVCNKPKKMLMMLAKCKKIYIGSRRCYQVRSGVAEGRGLCSRTGRGWKSLWWTTELGMEWEKAPLVRFVIDFDALHPLRNALNCFSFFLVCVSVCVWPKADVILLGLVRIFFSFLFIVDCCSELGWLGLLIPTFQKKFSNLANAASLLWYAYQSLPYPSNEVNWAGTYLMHFLFLSLLPLLNLRFLAFFIERWILFLPICACHCLILLDSFLVHFVSKLGDSRPALSAQDRSFRTLSTSLNPRYHFFSIFCLSCFLSPGLDFCCDRILTEIYPFIVRLASTLLHPCPSRSRWASSGQFDRRTLFMLSTLKARIPHSAPLLTICNSRHFSTYHSLVFFKYRILHPLTRTPLQPHSRPLSRKTSMSINPPRPGRLRNRILIRTPFCDPRHARLSGTYCLRRRKS